MLLPLPLSPTSAVIVPGRSSNETSSTAWTCARPNARRRAGSASSGCGPRAGPPSSFRGLRDEMARDLVARLDLAQHRTLGRLPHDRAPARSGTQCGQRGWKRQPVGGSREVGRRAGDPGQPRQRAASAAGTSFSSPCVYGCCGFAASSLGRRGLDDLARVHDRDPVRELEQERQVVRDEEHREAEARASAPRSAAGSRAGRRRRARSSARPG